MRCFQSVVIECQMNTREHLPQATRFLTRGIIRRVAKSIGYTVDGNHLFRTSQYELMRASGFNRFSPSVNERPDLHGAKAVRLQLLLSSTYDDQRGLKSALSVFRLVNF